MQPNAEMSYCQATFDLKAAREICSRIKGYEDPDGGNFADFQAAEMLPTALDEIERLQEKADRNRNLPDGETKLSTSDVAASRAKQIAKWQSEIDRLRKELESDKKFRCLSDRIKNQTIERQAKRIADLKAENENLREWGISNASDAAHEKVKTEKQLAALKKLGQAKRARGKALVEERANLIEAGGEPTRRRLLKEDEEDLYDLAREQLRREGKL